ncbi:putative DNA polymerase A [Erwinia phage Micant]|uniref:DNA polymerase A n=1 Tax=Erwinia phage Micant TaxID=2923255 RepID=A0AAE9JUL7_9CAUD|nr:putative DNA polymerase A [Erwinia phage Micant]
MQDIIHPCIMIIDLETENNEYYGSKASPYSPLNYVIESAWRYDIALPDGTTQVSPTQSVRYGSRAEFMESGGKWCPIPETCWLIVAHNAAYEISWFLQYDRENFENFLRRGGRVYCTMVGEYLVTDMQSMYPSLDETAPKYGGTHKVDGVKILWEQGVLTSQIDPILLHDYLVNGDIPNTALVFYGQLAEFNKPERNQMPLVWEKQEAMLAFAYCEWTGLWVNMPVARKNQAEQEARIAELKAELNTLLPELPDTFVFNWGSNFQMSALIYGGPIKYKRKVSYDPIAYEKEDYYYFGTRRVPVAQAQEIGIDVLTERFDSNIATYKSGKNKGLPKVFREDTDVEKLKWEETLFHFPGHIHIDSLPGHISEKYGDRGEFCGAQTLPDGSPVYSTSGDAMKGLAAQGFTAAKLVNELASLEKDTGTYYLRTEYKPDGETVKKVSGMLQYVIPHAEDGSGIIHHRLNTTATVTGRLSSGNPNLQNLPRDGTSKVKQMFTSRYGADGKIIEVDYSALEVVMGCVHTNDKKLLSLLQSGTDMHCYRLAFQKGLPYEEVKRLAVDDEDGPDYKEWKGYRTDIKAPSFAAQYGATAKGIAFATGMSVEFCQEFLDNEAKMFPDSIKFRDVIKKEVERTGQLAGQLKREHNDDGSISVYRIGYWTAPNMQRYSFRQKKQWKDRKQVMDYKATEMANYWCQGEAFFMMQVAFGMLIRHLINNRFYDGQVSLMTNVHDAAYLDAANATVGREAALATKRIMETARDRILQLWPAYGILNEVEFPAAAEMGESMYAKTHVH